MRIAPRIQQTTFDVSGWTPDAEFAIFPQGARAKEAFLAPDVVSDDVLVPNKRYLFKRSKKSYPDQFWGEVIAYRLGCFLGVDVPHTFYAINSVTHISGALVEWFYAGAEAFVHGGDFMQMIRPDYDRDRGTKHNLEDIRVLMQAIQRKAKSDTNWRQWWVDALLFDALIGNTDRHQDNWGLIFTSNSPQELMFRMAPLYDNGTSLGHERFIQQVENWSTARVEKYVDKGTHHVKWKWAPEEGAINGHLLLLRRAISAWSGTQEVARARLEFDEDELVYCLQDLLDFPGPVPLTRQRYEFIVRLLCYRFNLLKNLLNGPIASHR